MKERLMQLMNHLGLTAARFADEIGVQRSGISHILSGRNQPSYDFIVKTMNKFPDLNIEWLLTGRGAMISQEKQEKNTDFTVNKLAQTPDQTTTLQQEAKVTYVNNVAGIILLYNDGTFKQYEPAKKD